MTERNRRGTRSATSKRKARTAARPAARGVAARKSQRAAASVATATPPVPAVAADPVAVRTVPDVVAVPAAAMGAAAVSATAVRTLCVGSSLSIREVGAVCVQLQQSIEAGPVEIDLRGLESIDTAGVQLLLAAVLTARQRGSAVQWLGAEKLLSGAAGALGLDAQLAATVTS